MADSTARALLGARSTDFRSTDFSMSLTLSSFTACAGRGARSSASPANAMPADVELAQGASKPAREQCVQGRCTSPTRSITMTGGRVE